MPYNSPFTPNPPANPGGTKSTHWVVIRANGKIVGRIQSFAPTQSRTITRIFELNRYSTGRGVDLVPGVVNDDVVDVEGLELWTEPLEEALGASSSGILASLADQYIPFEFEEVWERPDGGRQTITYYGSFLENINPEAMQGGGDKVYKKRAKIHVLGRTVS